jgi:hypothetical protein
LHFAALKECETGVDRDRLLHDIAGAFYKLGMRSAARDAFLILAATCREQSQRWTSVINLMEIAAEDGSMPHFQMYKAQITDVSLPARVRAEFELHVGRGYQTLSEPVLAREWLERALTTATSHSLNHLVFKVEELLAAPSQARSAVTHVVPTCNISGSVERFADELRMLRELSVSTGE